MCTPKYKILEITIYLCIYVHSVGAESIIRVILANHCIGLHSLTGMVVGMY